MNIDIIIGTVIVVIMFVISVTLLLGKGSFLIGGKAKKIRQKTVNFTLLFL